MTAGTPRTFPFRFSRWSWGLAIDLTARATTSSNPPDDATRVGKRTWLRVSARLPEMERHYLADGLTRVAEQIDARASDGHVLVEVLEASFTLTEYQDNAMAPAIMAWACEEFELDAIPVSIEFDRAENQYVISYPAPKSKRGSDNSL